MSINAFSPHGHEPWQERTHTTLAICSGLGRPKSTLGWTRQATQSGAFGAPEAGVGTERGCLGGARADASHTSLVCGRQTRMSAHVCSWFTCYLVVVVAADWTRQRRWWRRCDGDGRDEDHENTNADTDGGIHGFLVATTPTVTQLSDSKSPCPQRYDCTMSFVHVERV